MSRSLLDINHDLHNKRQELRNLKDQANKLLDVENLEEARKIMENQMDPLSKEIDDLENELYNVTNDIESYKTKIANGGGITLSSNGSVEVSNKVQGSNNYRNAFWNQIRNIPLDSEQRDLINSREIRNMAISTNQAGGYLVPESIETTLVKKLTEANIMRQIAHVLPMEPGDRRIPIVADHGTAAWIAEGAVYPESEVTFDAITLGGFKIARIVQITEELMNDSVVNIENVVVDAFVKSFGEAEEEAFIIGDGTDRPTGVLGRAQVGITGADVDGIASDEVYDIYYNLKRPYRANAVWLLNDQSIKLIRQLKDASGQYLWSPGFGTEPPTLLGRPVYTSPYMPTMAAGAKSILFGDFSYYKISDRQGRVMQRLNELYAANGRVGLRMFQRVDGNLALPEAIKAFQNAAV